MARPVVVELGAGGQVMLLRRRTAAGQLWTRRCALWQTTATGAAASSWMGLPVDLPSYRYRVSRQPAPVLPAPALRPGYWALLCALSLASPAALLMAAWHHLVVRGG